MKTVDELTRKWTAFKSIADMCDAKGGYWPSLPINSRKRAGDRRELTIIADAYDAEQFLRGDKRRAYRG